jgi:hypothetical protein
VFGNGKTAIKMNFGRYLSPATNDQNYPLNNPANRIRTTLQRNWTDDGDKVVNCNILNPAQNGECAATSGANLNFGQPVITRPGGRRHPRGGAPVRATISSGSHLQQQLLPRVSATVATTRRWWKNYTSVDNINNDSSDYEKVTSQPPRRIHRLPGGGATRSAFSRCRPRAAPRGRSSSAPRLVLRLDAHALLALAIDVDVNARSRQPLLQAGTTTGTDQRHCLPRFVGAFRVRVRPGTPPKSRQPRSAQTAGR